MTMHPRAIGAIRREAHWTTYYKLIERAHVSVAGLSVRLLQLVQKVFPNELVNNIGFLGWFARQKSFHCDKP